MKLVIVSPFWNCPKLVTENIQSLKEQYYTNFLAYFIDDLSSDDSYDKAKEAIGDDDRFVLIKNTEKKYKTKNFIDIIRDNDRIDWDDVIIELDGDDKLIDNFVLGILNKVYSDSNIWICGTKFKDNNGSIGRYGRPNLIMPRKQVWNFSHMRSYRAFLFRAIEDDDLKYRGEYFKAACDIGFGMPMLEMAGEEHFHYIDEPMYLYNWHDKQSYSSQNSFGDKTLQNTISEYIYFNLKPYGKLTLIFDETSDENNIELIRKKDNSELLSKLFGGNLNTKNDINRSDKIKVDKKIYIPEPNIPKIVQTTPKKLDVPLKDGSLAKLARDISGIRPDRRKNLPNIFSKK